MVEEENEEEEDEADEEEEETPAPTPTKPLKPLKVAEPNKLYFKGKLKGKYNSNIFKAVEFVARLVDTIPLNIRPDGMRIWSSFQSMVGVVEITLDKSDFATYEMAVGDDVMPKFCVKSATLLNALNMAERGEIEIKGNAIIITEGKSRFSVPLLEADSEEDIGEKQIGDLKFAKTLEFSASEMSKIVSQMSKFVGGDNAAIKLDINNIRIKMSAGDLNKAEDEIPIKGIGGAEGSLVATYSTDLLKCVLKVKEIGGTTKLSFQNDYPLRIDFSNGTAKGMIVLAPRVESN